MGQVITRTYVFLCSLMSGFQPQAHPHWGSLSAHTRVDILVELVSCSQHKGMDFSPPWPVDPDLTTVPPPLPVPQLRAIVHIA